LNKILLVHVGISVKQVLPLILVCNLMLFFLNTLYARYRMNIKYIKKKTKVPSRSTKAHSVSVTKCYSC